MPFHAVVKVQWRDDANEKQGASVNVVDGSSRGLAFRSKVLIPPGQTVSIGDGSEVLSAVVRHCTQDAREYTIGVEIQGGKVQPPMFW